MGIDMYDYIVNPLTNRLVKTSGTLGKSILKNYINTLKGGSTVDSQKPKIKWGKEHITRDDLQKKIIASKDIDYSETEIRYDPDLEQELNFLDFYIYYSKKNNIYDAWQQIEESSNIVDNLNTITDCLDKDHPRWL